MKRDKNTKKILMFFMIEIAHNFQIKNSSEH